MAEKSETKPLLPEVQIDRGRAPVIIAEILTTPHLPDETAIIRNFNQDPQKSLMLLAFVLLNRTAPEVIAALRSGFEKMIRRRPLGVGERIATLRLYTAANIIRDQLRDQAEAAGDQARTAEVKTEVSGLIEMFQAALRQSLETAGRCEQE